MHIPFCTQKCPYCDFYSKSATVADYEEYTKHLIDIIKTYKYIYSDKIIDTIYFGGGTPSLIGTNNLINILSEIKSNLNINSPEITIEVNPTSSDILDYKLLNENGFNRVSIGLQSANDDELKLLGRKHTPQDVKDTIMSVKAGGINNISLDLMIGLPNQTKNSLAKSIEFCKSCNVNHISAYILKIEKNTPFFLNKSILNAVDDDLQADLYLFLCDEMKKFGFNQYEISNFAKDGCESKHNLKYWNCEEYIGVGPSAHSFVNGKRFYYPRSINDFFNDTRIQDGNGGSEEEYIMLRLRLNAGLSNEDYRKRFNKNIPETIYKNAVKFENTGLINIDENSIKLTTNGFLLSNTIISELLNGI